MLQNAVDASTQPRFFIDITKVLKTWNNFEHVFPDGYIGRIQIGKREAFTLSLFATNHSLALLLLPRIYCESRVCNEKVLNYHQLLNFTHRKVV